MKPQSVILYLITLALVYFNFNPDCGYTAFSPWYTHLTFHFTHANIFHLAANLLVVFLLLRYQRDSDWWHWPLCYTIATAVSFITSAPNPTVGLSGILLTYYGILCFKNGTKWRSMLYTLGYMAVSCLFAHRIAIGLHFICFAIGSAIGCLLLWKKNIVNTMARYNDKTK